MVFPSEFEVPFERQYEFMIHSLMTEYKMPKREAEEMTEYDYVLMAGFKGLDNAKQKYYYENKKD